MSNLLGNDLQLDEWTQRISNSTKLHFGNQVKYFVERVEQNSLYNSVLISIANKFPFTSEALSQLQLQLAKKKQLSFDCEEQEASFAYQLLKSLIQQVGYEKLNELVIFQGKDFNDTHFKIIEQLINPQVTLLKDKTSRDGLVLLLLERYKFRCEWFTRDLLKEKYDSVSANYEQILEDDVRLYLFDNGIDFPFSTPKSSSGRADIVSNLDSSDPLVAEIKIVDRNKGYGIQRIREGFTQIIKYATDYNKSTGYLILFNMDNVELNFDLNTNASSAFPVVDFNNKLFYFIVINCFNPLSASKIGKLKSWKIDRDQLQIPNI